MSTNTQFVVPSGEVNADDRLQHVAIQATAVMLQGWFGEQDPEVEDASAMVSAVMDALLRRRQPPQ
jgi:hypothetical protein